MRNSSASPVIVSPDDYHVTGVSRFYVVRGDSVQIPADMVARGFAPDPNRWYIERWEDETDTGAGAFALERSVPGAGARGTVTGSCAGAVARREAPAALQGVVTWGWLKHLYSR